MISPRAGSSVLYRFWRCELSAPAGRPDEQGTRTVDGTTCCAAVTTASCVPSTHAAPKTTYCATAFISGLSPLLRTVNLSSGGRAVLLEGYACDPTTTRLGKYGLPGDMARSGYGATTQPATAGRWAGVPNEWWCSSEDRIAQKGSPPGWAHRSRQAGAGFITKTL